MKGVSEYQIAMVIAIIMLMVLFAISLGWMRQSSEDAESAGRKISTIAGCASDPNSCKTNIQGYSCVHDSINDKNICGCRAWLGIMNNIDCPAGKICDSKRGTNFGICI